MLDTIKDRSDTRSRPELTALTNIGTDKIHEARNGICIFTEGKNDWYIECNKQNRSNPIFGVMMDTVKEGEDTMTVTSADNDANAKNMQEHLQFPEQAKRMILQRT